MIVDNGIYVGYVHGQGGHGLIFFVVKDDCIVGVDIGGVKVDGNFSSSGEDTSIYLNYMVDVPPNAPMVQGVTTGPEGMSYNNSVKLPKDFMSLPYVAIDTPAGQVNIRFERIRDLGPLA